MNAIAAAVLLTSAVPALAANPQVCTLAIGEQCSVQLAGGTTRTVKLLGYTERTEPFYLSETDEFKEAVVAAEVRVNVGGREAVITGGPYRMPVAVNGVSLLVAVTKGWTGGAHPDRLDKDVRLELQDAAVPFYAPDRFAYPLKGYRWRASNYQHTWLGLVLSQPRIYYHRGEDMGEIVDLMPVLSMTGGTITRVPPPGGDGESNAVVVEDSSGLSLRYVHMNAPHIRPDLAAGTRVNQGEKLGLTGGTFRGKPVGNPHLHLSASDSNGPRATFPMIVAAYFRTHPGAVLPIAGGWRYVWRGQTELDGSLSLASPGRRIGAFEWTFGDGTRARAARVRRTYPNIGTYCEQLRVTDDRGVSDLDFVHVSVLDRENRKQPPYAGIYYYPVRGVKPGVPVRFLVRIANIRDVTIDFGDGAHLPHKPDLTHTYSKAGAYVVTVEGKDNGSGPGAFKTRVVVE
jgi:murein DD-endopeptidase MepM/ murein hydrolase activator NlpD